MLEFSPDTCRCIADLDSNSLLKKCSIHETFGEMKRHNKTLNQAFVETDPETNQIKDIRLAKKTYYEKLIEDPTLLDKFRRFFST